jgi:hypothetical protein
VEKLMLEQSKLKKKRWQKRGKLKTIKQIKVKKSTQSLGTI